MEWERVKVVKIEMSDLDETLINLDEVSYAKENHDEDDYEPRYALHLNGPGKIGTTENNFEAPPRINLKYHWKTTRFMNMTVHVSFDDITWSLFD